MNSNSKSSWLSGLKKKAASIASDFAGLSAEDKSGGNDVSTLNTTVSPAPMKRNLVRQKVSSSLTTALGDRRHEWNVAVNGSDSCYLQIVVNQNEDEGNQVSLLVDLPFINAENSTHLKSLGFRIDRDLNSPDFYNADKDFLVLPTVDGIGDFVNQIIEILQLIQQDLDGVTEVDAYILGESSLFIAKSTKPSKIQNPDSSTIPANKRLKDVQAKDPKLMNFLAENFHQRFQELENHHRSGLFLSGDISEVAERIWKLSQLWMIFLDGDDLSFTQDHELYRHISDLANSHPRCSIEEEVSHWMSMLAGQMTDFEIALALWCGVDRVGSLLVLNGNFDETLDELIQYRNRVNPAFRGK
jgi:hypothetical protein